MDVTLPVYTGDRQRNLMIYVGCAYRLVIHRQLVVIHQNGAMHSQSVFDVCMYRVVCVSVLGVNLPRHCACVHTELVTVSTLTGEFYLCLSYGKPN